MVARSSGCEGRSGGLVALTRSSREARWRAILLDRRRIGVAGSGSSTRETRRAPTPPRAPLRVSSATLARFGCHHRAWSCVNQAPRLAFVRWNAACWNLHRAPITPSPGSLRWLRSRPLRSRRRAVATRGGDACLWELRDIGSRARVDAEELRGRLGTGAGRGGGRRRDHCAGERATVPERNERRYCAR